MQNYELKLNNHTKVYVVCPASFATGGPELLHQLVYHLRKLNLNAFMFYIPKAHPAPVHEEYRFYDNPYVFDLDDESSNILIVPEINTELLYKYEKIQKVIWWLSIDNYFVSIPRYGFIKRNIKRIFSGKKYFTFDQKTNFFHFVQSYYAKDYLQKHGIENSRIEYLSDYLSADFLKNRLDTNIEAKCNIVVYNPKKGFEFTQQLIQTNPNIEFIPIQSMTRHEVIQLLKKSKVYIDFGHHPGKDRIPREAALLGCCVITNRKGSASFFNDVKIGDEYKFDENTRDVGKNITNKILDCFNEFQRNYDNFTNYRNMIMEEEQNFICDLKRIFKSE
ncbi:MAG: hypothetical protein WCS26_06840 [Arcobacteraceae bacterium]